MITIRTNNQARDLVQGYELSDKERKEFDYYDNAEELNFALFFRYKGDIYDFSEVVRLDDKENFNGWHGSIGTSYFSGILVKILDDEQIIVGNFYQ